MNRYLCFIRSREDQGMPPQGLMDAMGKFVDEGFKAGFLIDTGGLAPVASAIRVRMAEGKVGVVDGPYSEAKEVIGGYAIVQFESEEEARELGHRFMQLHHQHWPEFVGECEIRQMFSASDMTPLLEREKAR